MQSKWLDIGAPNWITVESEEGQISREFEDGYLYFGDTKVCVEMASPSEEKMDVYMEAQTSELKYVKLRWNRQLPKDGYYLADEWERGYGFMGFRHMMPNRIMPWYFLMSKETVTQGYGMEVQPNAFGFWQLDTAGLTLILDVRNGGMGVKLNGRRIKAVSIICREYEGVPSYQAATAFCKAMCPNPIFPKYPVYGSNNWYYAYGNSSEEEILADTDYLVSLTNQLENPPFMVIDDGWQEHHRLEEYNGGPWRAGNPKFPDLKRLADKMKEKGVRTGIWTRLLLNEDASIPAEGRLPLNGCLDPTHPAVKAYVTQDVKRICEWGYELIKHDFSTFDLFGRWGFEMNPMVTEEGWHFFDRTLTSAEIVKQFYEAILRTAEPYDVLILGCNTIGHLGAGLMQMNRVGDDTSGLYWERTRQLGINTLAFRLPHHNTFYHIDADCVGIMGKIDWRFNRQWAQLLAESGTPLFISAKPGVLTREEEEELKQIMQTASQQKVHMEPMDWECNDYPEVWEDGPLHREYQWYEDAGLSFQTNPIRYQSFLSIE